jgi:hypothetical protein
MLDQPAQRDQGSTRDEKGTPGTGSDGLFSMVFQEFPPWNVTLSHFVELPRREVALRAAKGVNIMSEEKYDLVGKIMDFESGQMEEAEIIVFFQELIDNGMAWTLQGSYGRTATALIDAGHCHKRG